MVYVPSRIRVFPYIVTSIGGIFLSAFAPPQGAAFLLAASALALSRAAAFERLHPDGNETAAMAVFGVGGLLVVGAAFFAFSSTSAVLAGIGIVGTALLAVAIVLVTEREFPDELLEQNEA